MNEAEFLFTGILGYSRTDLLINKDLKIPAGKSAALSSALKRRICGEPVEYILGKTEFMGLEFKVNRNVLIPRPETEILVEKTIEIVRSQKSEIRSLKILDIGTGSGNIAVSLAKFLKNAELTATDISRKAIETAFYNACLNGVSARIKFVKSDLFSSCRLWAMDYGLIVSNPPYVLSSQIDSLQREINYEPRQALDGGSDGLDFYRAIIARAPDHLRAEGLLLLEMGFGQCTAIKEIFKSNAKFAIIEVLKDYSGIDRVIVARKKISRK